MNQSKKVASFLILPRLVNFIEPQVAENALLKIHLLLITRMYDNFRNSKFALYIFIFKIEVDMPCLLILRATETIAPLMKNARLSKKHCFHFNEENF
jgi:hypothetical protein